jgi:NADPH-dependent curcumin reductase CurA
MSIKQIWAEAKQRLISIAGSEEQAHFVMACYKADELLDGASKKDIAEMFIKGVQPSPTIDDFIDVDGFIFLGDEDVDSFNDMIASIEQYYKDFA